jgi:hypothetical protein
MANQGLCERLPELNLNGSPMVINNKIITTIVAYIRLDQIQTLIIKLLEAAACAPICIMVATGLLRKVDKTVDLGHELITKLLASIVRHRPHIPKLPHIPLADASGVTNWNFEVFWY